METILKEGCKKILNIFYMEKNKAFHLREIARRSYLNENSVSRFLSMLENEKVLVSFKEGNLKMFHIAKTKKTFSIFALFDVEKYESMPEIRKRAISGFLDYLIEEPIIVLLFGSMSKGNFKKDSDIDLLLVMNKRINLKNALDYSESQTAIKINAFQIEYKNFSEEIMTKRDKLISAAITTGYPITNHIKYYEEIIK